MFPRKLHDDEAVAAVAQKASQHAAMLDDYEANYEISDSGYGKDSVKLLHVQRHGKVHHIKEFEVNSHLKLRTKKDYLQGDNSDIVATDSQKNTVYLLAKQHGVKNPETFGLLLVQHYLQQYAHVTEAHVHVQEYPWRRINYTKDPNQVDHNHAFVFTPSAVRFCDVLLKRDERIPVVISGLKNLRVLKTTQSSFENFVTDEYRSLPDAADRVFSTNIKSSWQYTTHAGLDFDATWEHVKEIILENFAGDVIDGVQSPSVQHTIYLAQRDVLRKIKQIKTINVEMPNIHYFAFDTSKFPKVVGPGPNIEVFQPVDKPNGIIFSQLKRKHIASKL